MSKIEPLPQIHWSPEAALADFLEDVGVENTKDLIIIAFDNDGVKHVRSANLTANEVLWVLQKHIYELMGLYDD